MKVFVILAHYLRVCVGEILIWVFFSPLIPLVVLLLFLNSIGICPYLTACEILALFPGECSRRIRRLWYHCTLKKCGKNLCVEWMAIISNKESELGDNVWIGPFCWICRARIGNNTMFAGHIRVLSGKNQHNISGLDRPIREQGGSHIFVEIGEDCWIGNGVIVMADISKGSVVSAGAVVNKVFPSFAVIGGVPAKAISMRDE
jgi:virginiamycin A acetyltransferase